MLMVFHNFDEHKLLTVVAGGVVMPVGGWGGFIRS
jgi:hypothetical protein